MSQPRTARQYPADSYRTDPQGFGSRGTNSPLYQAYNEAPNRYPGPGRGDEPRPPRRSKGMVIATVAAAVVAGSAIGIGGAMFFGGSSDEATAAAAPTHSLEQIASTIGCKPDEGAKAAQFRQAACVVGSNRYTILTFESDKNMTDWQAEAAGYGGAYLVGTRWLVVANNGEQLDPFVDKLGGEIVIDKHH
jgi:hypothetical protein